MVCCISQPWDGTYTIQTTTSTCDLPSIPPSLPPFLRLAPQRVQHRTGLDCTTTSSSSSSSSSTNSRPALLSHHTSKQSTARKSRSKENMCYEVSCTGCGNATFAGCGRHVAAVRLGRNSFEGKEGRKRWGCRSRWWLYSSSLTNHARGGGRG